MKSTFLTGTLSILSCLVIIESSFQNLQAQLSHDEFELTAYIIMPEELLYLIKNGDTAYVLVDVRSYDEFQSAHIAGALNVPWEDGTFEKRRAGLPQDKTIILVSADGTMALKALRILLADAYQQARSPFREVFSIEGGMKNWPYREYLVSD